MPPNTSAMYCRVSLTFYLLKHRRIVSFFIIAPYKYSYLLKIAGLDHSYLEIVCRHLIVLGKMTYMQLELSMVIS